MTTRTPRHDSSAVLTSIVSFPVHTQPTGSGPTISHPSTTMSSATLQPAPVTPGDNLGPLNGDKSVISQHRRKWDWISRYPVAATLSIVILLVLILIIVMIVTLNGDVQPLYGQIPYNKTGIAVTGHNYLLDLDKRTLSIQWEITGCGEHRLSTYQPSEHFGGSETCGPFDRAVDIYLNDVTTPAFSYDPDYLPVSPTEGPLYVHTVINFEMEHKMGVYSASIYFPTSGRRHLFDQQLTAPFDDYILNAFVFVIDKATNESVHITRFAAADPLNNFVTFSRDTETTNKFTYETGNGTVTVDVESRALLVTISRSVLARSFTMCMLLVNWALTVGTVYITLVLLIRREKMSEAVLALPITVVLTIPAIRNLFVGSPPFGILLDVAGFFMQIILVALCSLVLLFVVVKPSGPHQPFSGGSGKLGSGNP